MTNNQKTNVQYFEKLLAQIWVLFPPQSNDSDGLQSGVIRHFIAGFGQGIVFHLGFVHDNNGVY